MRIWHDNSGIGKTASWFLKFIVVHDLQTRDKFYFICNDWFGVDRSDGQIDRVLPVATKKQKTEVGYLIEKETKDKMSDSHLWFSIFARPMTNPFTRTDRLTCAFVLLCLTMMANIMYFDIASSSKTNELVIGPFSFSQTQVMVGVMTNLIIFPPSFLILQLFRKSRRRKTRSMELKDKIERAIDETEFSQDEEQQRRKSSVHLDKKKKKKIKKKIMFPWWFKIFAYILSACVAIVCIFFIIVKGISFGDDMCRRWLTSFLISILTSVFLTQPLQVTLLSLFFVMLFRKNNDDQDFEYDPLDDGDSLNRRTSLNQDHKADGKVKKRLNGEDIFMSQEQADQLKLLREQRLFENKIYSVLKQLAIYTIFLTVLFVVAMSKTNPKSYNYQTQLQNLILNDIKKVFVYSRQL